MKPEHLLLSGADDPLMDAVLHDEMDRLWAHLVTFAEGENITPQIIAITASSPKEGVTTTTTGLARYLTYSKGRNVCIVEANQRRPALAQLLPRLKNEPGIHDLLTGTSPLDETVRIVDAQGLHLIPATGGGRLTSRSNQGRRAFLTLFQNLRNRHDQIIVDCPPLLPSGEAQAILKAADLTVLVAQSRKTRMDILAQSVDEIRGMEIPFAGVVMNQEIRTLPALLQHIF